MVRLATAPVLRAILLIGALLAPSMTAQAQSRLVLSNSSDFTTSQRLFQAGETLHILVDAPGIDATAVTKSTFEISPNGDGESFDGTLTNHLDGTFTASVPLAELDGTARTWRVEVEVEQEGGTRFEEHTTIVIQGTAEEPGIVTLRGEVSAASATEMTVAGQTVRITGTTAVVAPGEGTVEPADLVGTTVTVRGTRNDDGTLTALQVFAGSEASEALHLTGKVEEVALDGTSVTVRGTTVLIDSHTKIEGIGNQAPTSLLVGLRVKVTAQRSGDEWLATAIKILGSQGEGEDDEGEADDEEQEIEGTVDEVDLDASFVVVAGVRLDVNDETEFEGFEALSDLSPGISVEAEFVTLEDGSFLATEIRVRDDGGQDDEGDDDEEREEVEVEGTITGLTDDTIEVGGFIFAITGETEIEGEDDLVLTPSDLAVGLFVEVEGVRLEDGTLVATRIKVEDGLETELKIEGEITGKSGETLTIGDLTFVVDAGTKIKGERGVTLTFADVEVGMFAEAELVQRSDGTFVATELEVEDRFEEDEVEITGRIEVVSSTEITVGGTTFSLDAGTVVLDERRNPMDAGLLAPGQVVQVKGHAAADGSLVADQIRLRSRQHAEGEIEGLVTAVDVAASTLEVEGTMLRVSDQTLFMGVGGLSELSVGQHVEVRYRVLGDGSRLALKVELEGADDDEVEITGIIDAVEADAIVVADVSIALTADTEILGEDGEVLSASELAAGQTVEVTARRTADGLEAVRVRVEESVVVAARVESRTEDRIRVSGLDIVVSDQTLVVGRNNAALSLNDVQAGAVVEVLAVARTSAQGEQLEAERVTVQMLGTGTAVEPGGPADLPQAFTLKGNYPNPFNPNTTIVFEIGREAAGDVSLVVFNVLGQKVRTLVQGALPPGRYEYEWDGLDASGRKAASGVYLYRLQVGDQTQARSMTLLK